MNCTTHHLGLLSVKILDNGIVGVAQGRASRANPAQLPLRFHHLLVPMTSWKQPRLSLARHRQYHMASLAYSPMRPSAPGFTCPATPKLCRHGSFKTTSTPGLFKLSPQISTTHYYSHHNHLIMSLANGMPSPLPHAPSLTDPVALRSRLPLLRRLRPDRGLTQRRSREKGRHQEGQRDLYVHAQEQSRRDRELVDRYQENWHCWQGR